MPKFKGEDAPLPTEYIYLGDAIDLVGEIRYPNWKNNPELAKMPFGFLSSKIKPARLEIRFRARRPNNIWHEFDTLYHRKVLLPFLKQYDEVFKAIADACYQKRIVGYNYRKSGIVAMNNDLWYSQQRPIKFCGQVAFDDGTFQTEQANVFFIRSAFMKWCGTTSYNAISELMLVAIAAHCNELASEQGVALKRIDTLNAIRRATSSAHRAVSEERFDKHVWSNCMHKLIGRPKKSYDNAEKVYELIYDEVIRKLAAGNKHSVGEGLM